MKSVGSGEGAAQGTEWRDGGAVAAGGAGVSGAAVREAGGGHGAGEEGAGEGDRDYQFEMRQIDDKMEHCVSHFKARLLELLAWR